MLSSELYTDVNEWNSNDKSILLRLNVRVHLKIPCGTYTAVSTYYHSASYEYRSVELWNIIFSSFLTFLSEFA